MRGLFLKLSSIIRKQLLWQVQCFQFHYPCLINEGLEVGACPQEGTWHSWDCSFWGLHTLVRKAQVARLIFFQGRRPGSDSFFVFYPILWAFPQVEESLFKIGCVYGMVRSTRRDTEEQEVRTGSSPLPPSGRPSATPGKSPCAHVQREGLSPRLSLPLPNVIRGIVDNMTLPGSLSQRFWLSCSRLETWQLFLKKYNWVILRCGHGECLCQDCF